MIRRECGKAHPFLFLGSMSNDCSGPLVSTHGVDLELDRVPGHQPGARTTGPGSGSHLCKVGSGQLSRDLMKADESRKPNQIPPVSTSAALDSGSVRNGVP